MKPQRRLFFLIASVATLLLVHVPAHSQIRPPAKPGYGHRIAEAIDHIQIVDTHEHLMTFDTLSHTISLDFLLLFYNYPRTDFVSAGMPFPLYEKLWSSSSGMTVLEKWNALAPYWGDAFNTGYNRSGLVAADQLFGIKTLNAATVGPLSEKIRKAYQQDPREWFYRVLRDKCHVQYVVEDDIFSPRDSFFDPTIMKFVQRFDRFVWINSSASLDELSKEVKAPSMVNLEDLVAALRKDFASNVSEGIVGVKIALAYARTLHFDSVTEAEAKKVFARIRSSSEPLQFAEAKPLQDYMLHQVLDLVRVNHLPVQIHTGFQWGFGNTIENSKPTNLINLFREYPDVKFILFHGSYPYGGELATIAKSYQNVYIDTNWTYILSPSYAERYLHEWLETIPASKIMAFGGDDVNVEASYGHLQIAKRIIAKVLTAKVREGYFTEDEALRVAHMILRENAMRVFNLN